MEALSLKELQGFILQAKKTTLNNGQTRPLYLQANARERQFDDGPLSFHDGWIGGNYFIGQETVRYGGEAVWGMNYFGRIIRPDQITFAQVGLIVRESLVRMYSEGWLLGGFEYTLGEFHYSDSNQGEFEFFTGKEFISKQGEVVYELVYQGGLLKP